MSRRYAENIGLFDGRKTSTAAVAQLTGIELTTTLSVRDLRFAGQTLSDVPAEIFPSWSLEAVPVVLGLPARAQFGLAIDYTGGVIFVAKDRTLCGGRFCAICRGLGSPCCGIGFGSSTSRAEDQRKAHGRSVTRS